MKTAADRMPSIEVQVETLGFLLAFVGRTPPHMTLSEIDYHKANVRAAIATLLAEKERRLSPQEALDRLSKREP